MSRIRFWQGTRNSESAYNLRKELRTRGHNVLRIKGEDSNYSPRGDDLIINWGCSDSPQFTMDNNTPYLCINPPPLITLCSNKISFFQRMREAEVPVPYFTEYRDDAIDLWRTQDFESIYCRTLTQANSGRGIVVAKGEDEIVDAPLYTMGINNIKREVRIHIFQGSLLHFAEKKRMGSARLEQDGAVIDEDIRNYDNGFIFATHGVSISEEVVSMCIQASSALSLDMVVYDIVECTDSSFYFLEGNTAPGLQGSTLIAYADKIEELI